MFIKFATFMFIKFVIFEVNIKSSIFIFLIVSCAIIKNLNKHRNSTTIQI